MPLTERRVDFCRKPLMRLRSHSITAKRVSRVATSGIPEALRRTGGTVTDQRREESIDVAKRVDRIA